MKIVKYILLFGLCSLFFGVKINAQKQLSLDSCRNLALQNNKELQISKKELEVAEYKKKAAFSNYFPKVSALGTYMRNEKELSLLNDEQKNKLQHFGTGIGEKFQALGQGVVQKHPELAPVFQKFGGTVASVFPALDQLGSSVVNGLRTDTRNLYVGAVNVTQPIFVGGKIRAYNRITDYLQEIAENKNKLSTQEVLLQTDEAYWRVVSLSNKKKLADSYVELLKKMNSDIDKMIAEGVATKADGLTVKVKLNEAEMLQTKVNNGVLLSKMALCQICGIDLNESIVLADEANENLHIQPIQKLINKEEAIENRPEIQSLTLAQKAKTEKIRIERSEFLPQVALSGNYLVTNPSTFNGFENKFRGMWSVGIQVKVPIWHWGEGRNKVRIAKAEADMVMYQLEEVKEKISLQISQSEFKLNEAQKQLKMAKRNVEKAKENLRYAQLGFKEGVIPSSMVLKAQTAWYDAQMDKIDAQIQIKLSQVALEKALGTLSVNND